MDKNKLMDNDKKQLYLEQIKKIQQKIDSIEKQRADKINKLVKKFKLMDLSDETLEQEFSLIKQKYASSLEDGSQIDAIKKN